jgi:hypothetical protein
VGFAHRKKFVAGEAHPTLISVSNPTPTTPPKPSRAIYGVLLLAAATFLTGINWGLPSRSADQYLFAGRTPWTGAEIMHLAGPWTAAADRGADVPQSGVGKPNAKVVNATDADRAEIVRRYRLYSQQPDEMITFRSLSGTEPSHLKMDPRLYQYGGLWIYPIGAIIKAASILHLATVRSDIAWYLDHPEDFARFYLLARFYSAAWGLAGVFVVCAVARRWAGSDIAGWIAAALFATMPVVINSAHEAKPHLAGTVLTIACIGAGLKFLVTGKGKWCLFAGAIAGAATGMVLTGYAAFTVPVAAAMIANAPWKRRLLLAITAIAIGVAVFAITNPYVPVNLIFHRNVMQSNLGNTGAYYRPAVTLESLTNAANLLIAGTSTGPAAIAGVAILWWSIRRKIPAGTIILLAPAVVTLLQFIVLAKGKPAEYARFAETTDVVIAIIAAGGIARLKLSPRERHLAGGALVAATFYFGIRYDINFIANDLPTSTRTEAAEFLRRLGNVPVAVRSDPAPYSMPPVGLFDHPISLLPPGVPPTAEQVVIRPNDTGAGISSPISWANKPVAITCGGAPLLVTDPKLK